MLSKEVQEKKEIHKELKHALFYLVYIMLFVSMILLQVDSYNVRF